MSEPEFTAHAILLAGGSGTRMGEASPDKILHAIAGTPVWRHSFDAFVDSGCIQEVVIICRDEAQRRRIAQNLPSPAPMRVHFAYGGNLRSDSVWAGLEALRERAAPSDAVLIHDCARPLIAADAIRKVALAASQMGAACLARPLTDTIKRCQPLQDQDAHLPETIDRSLLWAMETPQAFRFQLIHQAYAKVIQEKLSITDDLSAIEPQRHPVTFVQNPLPNPKLTTPQDLAYLEFLITRP